MESATNGVMSRRKQVSRLGSTRIVDSYAKTQRRKEIIL
jgi:hypothetical protein